MLGHIEEYLGTPTQQRVLTTLREFSKYNKEINEKYKRSGIYCISCENKILYIGRSKDMYYRIQQHLEAIAIDGYRYITMKYNTLYEFSKKHHIIQFDVVEYAEEADLAEREAYWINYYLPPLNTQIPKHKEFRKQYSKYKDFTDNRHAKYENVKWDSDTVLSLAETRNIVAERGVVF